MAKLDFHGVITPTNRLSASLVAKDHASQRRVLTTALATRTAVSLAEKAAISGLFLVIAKAVGLRSSGTGQE